MFRFFIVAISLLFILIGCTSSDSISQDEIDKYSVQQTSDNTVEEDFIFRLVTEKGEYKVGEEINLHGELVYTGDKDAVTIAHSGTAIYFQMKEMVREYTIDYPISEIGVERTIDRNEVIHEVYVKQRAFSLEDDTSYKMFLDKFMEQDGFPAGYYVVNGIASFTVTTEGMNKSYHMEATVDFKVKP